MVFTQSYPEYMKRGAPVARALQAFEAENASGVRATLSWFVCCSFDVGLLLSAFVCVCVEAPCVRGICVSTVFSLQSGACGFALAGCVFLRIGFDCRDQQSAVSYVKSDEQVASMFGTSWHAGIAQGQESTRRHSGTTVLLLSCLGCCRCEHRGMQGGTTFFKVDQEIAILVRCV
jgi:hypothetical protein